MHKKYCNLLKFMTHCISAELIPCKGGRDFVQIYDMMSYFKVHAKADTSQVNLPNGTKKCKKKLQQKWVATFLLITAYNDCFIAACE